MNTEEIEPQELRHIPFKEALNMIHGRNSSLEVVTTNRRVLLRPKSLNNVKNGIVGQLKKQVNLFSKSLNGVVISFSNIKQLHEHGRILGDIPYIHYDIKVDFVVFRPKKGTKLTGVVNRIGQKFVGCVVFGIFNACVPINFSDFGGHCPKIGEKINFRVAYIDRSHRVISLKAKAAKPPTRRKSLDFHNQDESLHDEFDRPVCVRSADSTINDDKLS